MRRKYRDKTLRLVSKHSYRLLSLVSVIKFPYFSMTFPVGAGNEHRYTA